MAQVGVSRVQCDLPAGYTRVLRFSARQMMSVSPQRDDIMAHRVVAARRSPGSTRLPGPKVHQPLVRLAVASANQKNPSLWVVNYFRILIDTTN